MSRMWKRTLLVAAIGLTAGGAAGCAQERPPINRVQPNALAKSFFVGGNLQDSSDDPEFWTQGTLVDVGYGAAQDGLFTSTYAQPLSRIKWVIQEDLLVGRITYERISGSDTKGASPAANDGDIAVIYPIIGHFDIRRDYNPTTGEESNIIVENTSDRPWNEREYMRVDWSRNLAVDAYDYDTLSLMGVFGGVTYEALSYYVNDPNSEDAPHFDPESGYFDVTNKAFAVPATIAIPPEWGGGEFPACFLDNDALHGTAPSGSCNPVELTIRQSFRRVVDKDFEPQDWDGERFQAFGAFTVDRTGYARNYGMSDNKWYRFISRYNIWERSHKYANPESMTGPVECFTPGTTPYGMDPHRDNDGNGTEDECQSVGRGSQCDTFKQRCTLPYRERKTVAQAWYYTKGSNPEFFDGTEWAAHEWDVALRGAVMTAKYAECKRTGDEDCSQYPVYSGQQNANEDAVNLAREVDDCRNGLAYTDRNRKCDALADELGAARGYEQGVIALAKMPEMIVLCHSPVEANDPAACGSEDVRLPAGTTAAQCDAEYEKERMTADGDENLLATCRNALNVRMGDLRYHQVNVLKAPQTPSSWGIYTDAEDPLTGEKVAASINVWSFVNDFWSQSVVDTARYIKGELATADVTEGTYVRDWAEASKAAGNGNLLPKVSKAELKKRTAAFAGKDEKSFEESTKGAKEAFEAHPEILAKIKEFNGSLKSVRADATAVSDLNAVYNNRRERAIGSPIEAQLTTKPMLQVAGADHLDDSPAIGSMALDMASPLRMMNPTVQRQIRQRKELALASRGACIMQEAPAPVSMPALADVLEAKFGKFNPLEDANNNGVLDDGEDRNGDGQLETRDMQFARAERMRHFIAQRAQYAVIAHEMGHSVGLRHNFVSSADAWGYRPQYWQLRTKNGTVTTECTDLVQDGASCVGPRYFDPMTDEESSQLEWMWMQSSIMDYAGESTQDLVGIGAYDFAAARMFYGNTISVHADPSYTAGQPRGQGMLNVMDDFGGILGLQWQTGVGNAAQTFHYSQIQNEFDLIHDCGAVDPALFKPASWNTERDGEWHPVLDGHIVSVDGQPTRCKEQPVDYVSYQTLRKPFSGEAGNFYRGSAAVDKDGRVRVPYGFASDNWADTGNVSVFRHDNGADPYELFNFFIAQQEIGHIFDNYRRNRQSFSVRSASERTLSRWNEKMRDAAKGLGLYRTIYQAFTYENGWNFDDFWTWASEAFFKDNILASGVAFDHFSRMVARPEPGPPFRPAGDTVLRSSLAGIAPPGPTRVVVPNGATGYKTDFTGGFTSDVGFGGKPIENLLAEDKGDYNSQYTINAGCYYDKAWASMLFTESADNFISSTPLDFVDARYRNISIADMFPDGYRRWLGNNLTGDDELKGPRVAADGNGNPVLDTASNDPDPDAKKYPARPVGWTSWWTATPEVCWPGAGSTVCSSYGSDGAQFGSDAPANTAILDPQVGWEQQKFLIAWTLMYLPENQYQSWINQMGIWEVGADTDPGFANRIEFHDPSGKVYVARSYGKETIFGKVVEKGIGGRMLEWANQLLFAAYETTDGPDLDGDGNPDWYIPALTNGVPVVKWDPTIAAWGANGQPAANGKPGCNAASNAQCTCAANRACVQLEKYTELPFFMRQAMRAYGLADPSMKGIYD